MSRIFFWLGLLFAIVSAALVLWRWAAQLAGENVPDPDFIVLAIDAALISAFISFDYFTPKDDDGR